MGHFGKLKALRTFVDRFSLKLDTEDANAHTIVHYAARQGKLGVLLFLEGMGEIDMGKENKFNISAAVYAMVY
jgi:hypothetical protein